MNPEEMRTRQAEMTESELADAEDDRNKAGVVGWWVGIPVRVILVQTRRQRNIYCIGAMTRHIHHGVPQTIAH